jgi:general secretion pathway protein G
MSISVLTNFHFKEFLMKRGFTMIELVFVIVILGILASIAIPRLAASRDDARAVSVKQDVSTLSQAVPAWYQSQGDVSVENALQFDTALWVNTAGNMEYVYTDSERGTIRIRVFSASIDDIASNVTVGAALAMDATNKSLSAALANGQVPWLAITLTPATTNRGIVYTLLNDMKVSNQTLIPMAGRRINWNN